MFNMIKIVKIVKIVNTLFSIEALIHVFFPLCLAAPPDRIVPLPVPVGFESTGTESIRRGTLLHRAETKSIHVLHHDVAFVNPVPTERVSLLVDCVT